MADDLITQQINQELEMMKVGFRHGMIKAFNICKKYGEGWTDGAIEAADKEIDRKIEEFCKIVGNPNG